MRLAFRRPPSFRPPRLLAALVSVLVGVHACSDGPVGPRAGSYRTLEIDVPFSSVVVPGHPRHFWITSQPRVALRIFLQGRSGRSGDSLVAVVRVDQADPVVGTVGTNGAQAALRDRVLVIPATSEATRYAISVAGANTRAGGDFTILATGWDHAPERAARDFPLGDTLEGEWFDADVDIDRLLFMAEAGAEYVFGIATGEARPGHAVGMQVVDSIGPGDLELRTFAEFPWVPRDLGYSTLRFKAATTRAHYISAYALEFAWPLPVAAPPVGPYRLWGYKVDSMPERRPSLVAVGDTIHEAIDHIGDLDVFRFQAVAGQDYRLDVHWDRALSSPISLQFYGDNAGAIEPELGSPLPRPDDLGFGFQAIETGPMRFTMRGGLGGRTDSVTADYRLELRRVLRTPESRAAALVPGDTVRTEAIERPGDIDEFTVAPMPGRIMTARVIAEPSMEGAIRVEGIVDFFGQSFILTLFPGQSTETWRIVGTDGVPNGIRVFGLGGARGAYRVEIDSVSTSPELVSPVLPLGAWVGGETIVPVVDVDSFRFPVVQGRRYDVLIALEPGATGNAWVYSYPGEGFYGGSTYESGQMGQFIASATGTVAIEVGGVLTGSYRLQAVAVDTMPEVHASALAVGDSVRDEALDILEDIDEYTFAADSGDTISLVASWVDGTDKPSLAAVLRHPVTGEHVWTWMIDDRGSYLLQASGTYRIRVYANKGVRNNGRGAYRLDLRRGRTPPP